MNLGISLCNEMVLGFKSKTDFQISTVITAWLSFQSSGVQPTKSKETDTALEGFNYWERRITPAS